jgi:Tol biopolymer transport system component
VDHRTDIFAFGCVLYEMLTGRQTFPGEGVSDILASVLKSEPDWNRLPNDTPAAARRVLRRCLRKDRNRRLQTIGDARIEIEDGSAEPETVVRPQRREVLKWIGAGAGGAVAGALGASFFRKPTQASETRVLDLALPSTPDPTSFALSPDGSSLVFVASGDKQPQLWLKSLNTGLQQPLAGTEGATFPFWKPDSQAVAFVADYKLKRIDIGGGAPQTLASVLTNRGGSWGPNGVILFTPNGSAPLFRVSDSPGGTAVAVTNLEPDHSSHRFPYFLPGGKRFLFFVWGSAKHQGIYLGSLDSTKIQLLVLSVSAGAYLPSGWLLFVRSETLVAQRFDSANGKLSGGEVRIGAPVGADGGTGYGAFSVSATGLVAHRAKIAGERQLMWFNKKETMLGTFGSRDENNMANPAISPDGLRVAVDRVVQGNQDVWILDPIPQQFTTNKDVDSYPIWSPGGRWIMFRSNRTSAFDLYLKPTKDEIDETLLVESPELKVPNDWNGQYILYYKVNRPTGFRSLWLLPIIEDGKPGESRAFQSHDRDEFNGKFSPDGQFVAYQSIETPGREINVVRLLGKARPLQVSKGGGIWPQWSPDRNELYYLRLDGMLMAVSLIEKGAELERGDEQELFRPRIVSDNVSPLWQYDVARKGEHRGHFLINVEGAVTSPITLVLNWKPPSN